MPILPDIVLTVQTEAQDTRQEYPVLYLRVIEGDLCESDDHRFLLHDHWLFRLKGHRDRFALLRVEMTRHWLKEKWGGGENGWVGWREVMEDGERRREKRPKDVERLAGWPSRRGARLNSKVTDILIT